MNTKPYFKICPDGTVNVQPPPQLLPGQGYSKKPVQVAIRYNPLRLELHGEAFTASANLSTDDALSIAMMLVYAVREKVYGPQLCEFVEVSK